jgi:inosine-uridine nucleoside N-ribohydrolase
MTPVELYRSVLHEAKDESVNIVSIGFLTNLADLLRSEADHISEMSGLQLARSKVRELVIMGGMYPSGWEFNFGGEDPASTAYVLEHWPSNVPATYSGGELGKSLLIRTTLRDRASYPHGILQHELICTDCCYRWEYFLRPASCSTCTA